MDYALGSLLRFHPPELKVVLSYDIACQFSKNLVERIKKLPPMLRFEVVALSMRFVIPKLHILGHQMSCQLLYNLAYLLGMARTDGESVERGWAHLGPLATSLRQMGPGSAADTQRAVSNGAGSSPAVTLYSASSRLTSTSSWSCPTTPTIQAAPISG